MLNALFLHTEKRTATQHFMKDKLAKIIFSTRLMALLFVIYATAMVMGTFVESWYSTETARIWIYNAWWFELIMLLFVINFTGNIFRYKLLRKEKWPVLLLHLSFSLILIGAFVTRYISYEGIMTIREGQSEQFFFSEKTYLTAMVDGDINGERRRKKLEGDLIVTPEGRTSTYFWNELPWKSDFNGQDFKIEYVDFIEGAQEGLVPDENGEGFLKIVEASGGQRHEHFLKEGEVASIHNILFALNNRTQGAINILEKDGQYQIEAPFEGNFMRMADQLQGTVIKDSVQPLMLRSLYNMANLQFVIPEPITKGVFDVVEKEEKTENDADALIVRVSTQDESQVVKLLGSKGRINPPKTIQLGGLDFHLAYGSKQLELPFSITLYDFIAEKYPGTERNPTPSYAAFKSKVRVNDQESYDYDIFMNHVLDHRGYRFFQASFDPDELGSHLSVSHDRIGTGLTYLGYFLLYAGLMGIMFFGKTRFKDLGKMLRKVKAQKSKLAALLLFTLSSVAFAQEEVHTEGDGHDHSTTSSLLVENLDSLLSANAVTKEHAAKFGSLVIQDVGGRMKPTNTFASEMLRKVSKRDTYNGMNADQVLLSMTETPFPWYQAPLVYVKWQNDSIRKIIGAPESGSRIPLAQFFTNEGAYKLAPYLEDAYRAKVPNSFQKGFIETDRRVNLLYSALEGRILRIFPVPGDENNTFVSYREVGESNFKGNDSLYVRNVLPLYATALRSAKETGDYTQADQLLESIKGFQKRHGEKVLPSEKQIQAEVLYNKLNIFNQLYRYYAMFGVLMLILLISQIFKDRKWKRLGINIFKVGIILLFVAHLAGLIARWYISGHAPWSDAYEAIVYMAWATMALALAFARKSNITVAGSAFVTAILLWVAHQSWTDPAIANLQAVLDSYWLMIHVAVIVASYGPFTLGAILGIIVMLLILLTNNKNKERMKLNIKELSIINEVALTVGLVMLTIGNFLGGQWANESWGRYWGWDPKETWALISIVVYAFVIHTRLVPGLRGRFAFNWLATFAFMSIIFTYFGVNFILSGLHSYASGDAIIGGKFFAIYAAVWIVVGFLVYPKYKKYFKKG